MPLSAGHDQEAGSPACLVLRVWVGWEMGVASQLGYDGKCLSWGNFPLPPLFLLAGQIIQMMCSRLTGESQNFSMCPQGIYISMTIRKTVKRSEVCVVLD